MLGLASSQVRPVIQELMTLCRGIDGAPGEDIARAMEAFMAQTLYVAEQKKRLHGGSGANSTAASSSSSGRSSRATSVDEEAAAAAADGRVTYQHERRRTRTLPPGGVFAPQVRRRARTRSVVPSDHVRERVAAVAAAMSHDAMEGDGRLRPLGEHQQLSLGQIREENHEQGDSASGTPKLGRQWSRRLAGGVFTSVGVDSGTSWREQRQGGRRATLAF